MSKFKSRLKYFFNIALVAVCLSSPSSASSSLPDVSEYKRPLIIASAVAAAGAAYYYGATPDVSAVMEAMPCAAEEILNASLAPDMPYFFVNSTSLFQVAVEIPSKAVGWTSQLVGWIPECYNRLAYTTYAESQSCLEYCFRRLATIGRTTDACLAFVRCFSNGTQVLTCDFYRDKWYATVNAIYNASADMRSIPPVTDGVLHHLQYSHQNLTFHWDYKWSRPFFKSLLNFWGV